jgi:hypothetical protein
MPYYIQTPRGLAEFNDDVPEDVARRELFNAHPEFFPDEARRYYGRQDIQGETTAVGRGFQAGWERATGNVGALFDYATGGTFEDFKQQLGAVDQAANKINPYPTTFDDVARAYEIEGTMSGLEQFGAYVGELLGGSAPYAGASIAGGVAGTAVAPGPGTVAGMVAPFAGASAAALPLFVSDNIARQVEEGAQSDEDIDWLAAVGAGAGQSALNAAGPVLSGIFGRTAQTAIISQLLDKAATVPGGRYAAAGIGSAAVEAFTEAGQTALERAQAGLDPFDDDEIRDAMIGGGVLGLLLGPVGASRSRPRGSDGADPQVVENPSENVAQAPETPEIDVDPMEQVREQPLALPAPEEQPRGRIFESAPEPDPDVEAQPVETESVDQLAREALKRTRQVETQALLAAARETVTPIGSFDIREVGPDLAGKVNIKRVQRGQAATDTFTLEDLAPVATRKEIDTLISRRRPTTADSTQVVTPQEVTRAAQRKNIIPTDDNFRTFALRTTGQSNPERMSQTQLRVMIDKIEELPVNDAPVTLPIVDAPLFTEKQYGDAVTAIRDRGRYSMDTVKEVTGLTDKKTLDSIRDALVRRGQIVQKGRNDYRLYDVIGTERRPTPADLPEAATTSHVVREMPVSKVRVRKNGKSIGTFDSQTAAQEEISRIRRSEAKKGAEQSSIQIEPADEVAYGVVENRYDPEGNLIGKAVVDSHRDLDTAAETAETLNRNDEPDVPSPPTPRKPPAPEVIRGRMGEVMEGLRKLAKDRNLPLIDTRIKLTSEIKGPEGAEIEADFEPMSRIISVAVANLDPKMSTARLTEQLSQIVDHELIHALYQAGVLGPETDGWKTLDRYVRRAKRSDTGETYYQYAQRQYAGIPGYETEADFVEEAIADAFRTWAADKRSVSGKPATVFRQIVEFFKRLLSSIPNDLFEAIESGRLVEQSIRAPGSDTARARNVNKMETIKTEVDNVAKATTTMGAAERGKAEQRVKDLKKQFVDVQAQSRENRRGKSIPKTVMGFTPSPRFAKGSLGSTGEARAVTQKYRENVGNQKQPLPVYLPEPLDFLEGVANAHDKALHQSGANAVRKAYSALKSDVLGMFRNLGDVTIIDWREGSEPYSSPADMMSDLIGNQRVNLRLSNDMFGPDPKTANHPMNETTGLKTDTGRDVTYNDLFRVVQDFYGHGQAGFRYDPRDLYNAYHETARIVSPEALPALAAETLGPNAWQNYGKHIRRDDGTIPHFGDVDYLPQPYREFAEDKAYVIHPDILAKDPGLKIIEEAESATNTEFGEMDRTETPRRFSIKGRKDLRLEEIGSPKNRPYQYLFAITDPDDAIIGEVLVERDFANQVHVDKARNQKNEDLQLGDPILNIQWAGTSMNIVEDNLTDYVPRLGSQIKEGEISQTNLRNMASWLAERFPDIEYFYGSRFSGTRARAADAERMDGTPIVGKYAQVVPTASVRQRLEMRMPGGRKYGLTNPTPGGEFVLPSTPPANFSASYDGNKRFAGSVVEAQLGMVRSNDDGAVLVYFSPDEFLDAVPDVESKRQDEYTEFLHRGMKFNTMPSMVLSKNEDVPSIVGSDGAHRVRALKEVGVETVPVILYPKNKKPVNLITGIKGRSGPVRMPVIAENFPRARNAKPRYSIKVRIGDRVPKDDPVVDQHNIVFQRTEGSLTNFLREASRSTKELPFTIPFLGTRTALDTRVKLQDKMLPVKMLLEDIQAKGGKVADTMNVYVREQLYHGRVAHAIEDRVAELYKPALDAIKTNKNISLTDVEEYLYARHAPERNTHLRAAGSPEENPSGMSDEEAQTIMDNFASEGKIGDLQAVAVMIDNVLADTTRTRIDNGLLSQTAADRTPYQYYVPLRGFAEEDADTDMDTPDTVRARIGRGFNIGGKEDKSAFGRKRKAGDILGHVLLQNEEAVIRSEKNRVAVSAAELAEANPDMGIKILGTAPTRLVKMPNGQIRSAGDPSYRQRPDIVTAKVGGREIVMQVEDPRVARSIRNDAPSVSGPLIQTLAGINRYLATINTAWNPEFLISNLVRDLTTARILSEQFDIEGFRRNLIRDVPGSMKGIREVLRDGAASTEYAQAFQELQRVGGTTEFLGIRDLEKQLKAIQKELNTEGAGTPQRALKAIGKVGKFIEDYNKIFENGVRLSAYMNARKAGVSQEQAAYLAKNLTVNFNKGGEMKTAMNAWYLFYNASLQGTMVLLNGMRSRRVQKVMGGLVMFGALQDMANRMMSGDEDGNGINDYDEIPDYIAEHNFIMMDPFGILEDVAGIQRGYIALPMPYGFNAFHNLGRNLSGVLSGNKKPGKAASSIIMTAANSFNPLGGTDDFLNFMAPTIFDPFIEITRNKDFAGRDIVPERPTFGVPVPQSQKYWNSTAEPFKWVSEQLNSLTGGNTIRSGVIDRSPEVLEHWFDYALGAAGTFAKRTGVFIGDTVPSAIRGDFEDIEIGQIPFIRRVVGNVTDKSNTEAYYENSLEVMTVAEEMKQAAAVGNGVEIERLVAMHPREIALVDMFTEADKSLQGLRRQLRETRENEHIPLDQRREIEKTLRDQMDEIMRQMNRVYVGMMQ